MEDWYRQLAVIKDYLIQVDPCLKTVFDTVDQSGFQLHSIIKSPYVALISAIIGQKISYAAAKALRGKLFSIYGTSFGPNDLYRRDLSFLGNVPCTIIQNVTEYILCHNIDLSETSHLLSLQNVSGIGEWTIETTLLTCLKNWDIFPLKDKFLQARMTKLYGKGCDTKTISLKWAPYRSVVTWYMWRWF